MSDRRNDRRPHPDDIVAAAVSAMTMAIRELSAVMRERLPDAEERKRLLTARERSAEERAARDNGEGGLPF